MGIPNTYENEAGFTLTEVIIAVGVLSIAILAALMIAQQSSKTSVTANVDHEISELRHDLATTLHSADLCTSKIGGGVTTNATTNGSPLVVDTLASGTDYGRYLRIQSLTLENVTALPTAGTYRAQASITIEKKPDVFGSKSVQRQVSLLYSVNATNAIDKCYGGAGAVAANPPATCAAFGGTWDMASSRCDMCASLGGTRVAGTCRLPGGTATCTPSMQMFSRTTDSDAGGPWQIGVSFLAVKNYIQTEGTARGVPPADIATAQAAIDSYSSGVPSVTDWSEEYYPTAGRDNGSAGKIQWSLITWHLATADSPQNATPGSETAMTANYQISFSCL